MPSTTKTSMPISSVDVHEMAFAMALFDGAANGRIPFPNAVNPVFSSIEMRDANSDVSQELLRNALDISEPDSSDEVSLALGLAVLWNHYQGDERQQMICSRLLAFYEVMAQRIEPIFGKNSSLANAGLQTIFREASIIRIVASAPLDDREGFDEASFRDAVPERERTSTSRPESITSHFHPSLRIGPPRFVTESVEHLAKLLYIYEACAHPPLAQSDFAEFMVLRRFCGAVAQIGGTVALKSLFARAVASTRSKFPWLSAAVISVAGQVEGLKTCTRPLTPTQVLEGELALVGTLVQSLRSALGDDVTISLLRALWPLASFPTGQRPDGKQ